MKAVYILIPVVIIAVIVIIAMMAFSMLVTHRDNNCATWSSQISSEKARLSSQLFPSQEDTNALNSQIDRFNQQCANGGG